MDLILLEMKMTRIVIDGGFGEHFRLSDAAVQLYEELSGSTLDNHADIDRSDPILLQVVDTLGLRNAEGPDCMFCIVEVAAGTRYCIITDDVLPEYVVTEFDLDKVAT
jgi:hypothetical protein